MRANSGGGKGGDELRDPTMRDQERARGVSGEAIQGEKKSATSPDRQSARKHGQQ